MPQPLQRKPQFIVLEGIDGSGKSTVIRMLAHAMELAGLSVQCTKHPGGTPLGSAIRNLMFSGEGTHVIDPIALEALFLADHCQNMSELVEPALKRGEWVIADRHWATVNPVYSLIRKGHRFSDGDLARYSGRPHDMLVLLDGDPSVLLERARNRPDLKQSTKKWNTVEHMAACRKAYLDMQYSDPRTLVVDVEKGTPAYALTRITFELNKRFHCGISLEHCRHAVATEHVPALSPEQIQAAIFSR